MLELFAIDVAKPMTGLMEKKIVWVLCFMGTLTKVFKQNLKRMDLLIQSLSRDYCSTFYFASVTEIYNFVFQTWTSKPTIVAVHNLCSLRIVFSIRLSMTHWKHLNPGW